MQIFDRSVFQHGFVNDAHHRPHCHLLVAIDHHERADLRERRICNNSLLAGAAELRKVAA
jgi:hypothetical protein